MRLKSAMIAEVIIEGNSEVRIFVFIIFFAIESCKNSPYNDQTQITFRHLYRNVPKDIECKNYLSKVIVVESINGNLSFVHFSIASPLTYIFILSEFFSNGTEDLK